MILSTNLPGDYPWQLQYYNKLFLLLALPILMLFSSALWKFIIPIQELCSSSCITLHNIFSRTMITWGSLLLDLDLLLLGHHRPVVLALQVLWLPALLWGPSWTSLNTWRWFQHHFPQLGQSVCRILPMPLRKWIVSLVQMKEQSNSLKCSSNIAYCIYVFCSGHCK